MSRPQQVAELTDHLGFWLRMVSNHVSHSFSRRLEGEGVTVAEWVVLRELYGTDPLAPSRLAERLGMTRGAISKLADRLMAKGLVARADDPRDGRAHSLSLSSAGLGLVPMLARLADENEAAIFGCLCAEDRSRLEQALKKIAQARGLNDPPLT
ncbi:MarR family winged helix-turn-helix transcriptional regulator [Niveispirillum fermenti]|uniref:MarR family winged helix-turn-helix transcriptional regulator n=1 Tax=Niveispirillum fermenti TaxID=1233113 RepID=UPI003A8ABDA7